MGENLVKILRLDNINVEKQEENNKNRITYLDISRGIAIILMIIGHVVARGWKRDIIFSFHMPLFIIVSGMFFKPKKNIREELVSLFKKLIIPYIFTIIITYIFRYFIYNQAIDFANVFQQIILAYSNKRTFFSEIGGVGVLWFIPFLVICKIIYYCIDKISKENDILKGLICLMLSIIGLYLTKVQIFLPWSLDISLASMIFYYIGYIFKKYDLLSKMLKDYKVFICIIIMYVLGLKFGYIELAIRQYPYGLICFITAICGTIIIFQISKIIERFLKYITKILCWYGKNSMYILCAHYLEMNIIKYNLFGINIKWQLIVVKIFLVTIVTMIYLTIRNKLRKRPNYNEKIKQC